MVVKAMLRCRARWRASLIHLVDDVNSSHGTHRAGDRKIVGLDIAPVDVCVPRIELDRLEHGDM